MNASVRFCSFATSSIVIADEYVLDEFLDFGAAYRSHLQFYAHAGHTKSKLARARRRWRPLNRPHATSCRTNPA